MYENQESRVIWNGTYGEYFKCGNGVRQGGVAFPVLNTIYMDELTTRLEKSGTGCFIGHQYYGCISYADDLVLLCSSVKGLQRMATICEMYGIMYNNIYNAKKSMCLAFDRTKYLSGEYNDSIPIFLNGNKLQWVKCVEHLGNYISYDLSEEEIRHKKGDFMWQVNGLLIRYRDVHPEVKCICLIYIVVIFMDHRLGLCLTVKQTKWLQREIEESEKYGAYALNLIEIFFVVSMMGNIYGIVFLKYFVVCVSL